jgi:purine-binding chemotaxis protein CheW
VFEVGGEVAAFPIQNVQRIVPMARLAGPPGLPSMLQGILNLAGTAVPVLRLDRLFQLTEQCPGLYSMLIITKGVADGPAALLVDRVRKIVTVAQSAVLPAGKQSSFNDCADGVVTVDEELIHLLSPSRVLLAEERKVLSEFQEMADRRLRDWCFKE